MFVIFCGLCRYQACIAWLPNATAEMQVWDLETGILKEGVWMDDYRTNKPLYMTGTGTWYFGDQRADNGEVRGFFYGGMRMVCQI